jgi:DNA-binding NtrC family response regulator
MERKIIVIDDELDFLDSLKRGLKGAGFRNVHFENDSVAASKIIESEEPPFDIALIDITMPNISGIQLLELIKSVSPLTECIMITALNDAKTAISCLKKGAYDYLVKPVTRDDLVATINRALERLKFIKLLEVNKNEQIEKNHLSPVFEPIITQSLDVLRVLKEAELHAQSDIPVLITGESGTGKDLLAKAIHQVSHRAQQTYMPVNMAAINSGLFEAEFLGHTKGAFTGAAGERIGYLEKADRGTLFLDEIGSTPLDFQGKLLRILQDGEYYKLGSSQAKKALIRFVSATNMDLDTMMSKGEFRKDFYYRIKGAWLHLPPLKSRLEDLILLIRHFLEEFTEPPFEDKIDEETLAILMSYDFPGNIRELKSIVQFAVNLAQDRKITPDCLPQHLLKKVPARTQGQSGKQFQFTSLETVEKAHIIETYQQTRQNKVQTARHLGIGLNTLRRKLKSYGIQ